MTRQPLTPFQRDALLGVLVLAAVIVVMITFGFVLALHQPVPQTVYVPAPAPPAVVVPPAPPPAPAKLDKDDAEAIDKLINAMPAKQPEVPIVRAPKPLAVSVGARSAAPALEATPCRWHLADNAGQSWEHADKAYLERFVEERNKTIAHTPAVAPKPYFAPSPAAYSTPMRNVAGHPTMQYCPNGTCYTRRRR